MPTSSRTASITALAQNSLSSRRSAPTLDDAFSLVAGDLESARRLAALPLLFGIEAAEVLADDFRRRVLVDALRAHVPVGDVAVLIEHEDRVIGDALDDHAKAPLAFDQRLLRLAALGDVVSQRHLDAFPLVDLGVEHIAGGLEGRGPLVQRFLQLVMRALQVLLGLATGGDVLRDCHEVTHRAALVGHGRHVGPHPASRAVGQDVPGLGDEAFAGLDGVSEQIDDMGEILGIGQVLHAHLQQLRRRALDDFAKSIIDEAKPPARIGLHDAHDRLAEHGTQHLVLLVQPGFDASSRGHVGAERETQRRTC